MKQKRGKIREAVFLSMVLLLSLPNLPLAQPYPTKPVSLLISVTPGGARDTATRALAIKAEKFLGQPFIVSNNGGGGGSVAQAIVARQKPDGYHLVGCSSAALNLIPHLRSVPYKLDDFVPIMHFGALQTGVVVRGDSPWKTFKEFVEYAKKNPGKVTYSTSGVGTPNHLGMEFIGKQEGIRWTHIPYQGGAAALTALLGGHVTAEAGDATWSPHVLEGSVRLLAIQGEQRIKTFPNVPTFKELGYDFSYETVGMIAAPKGTPSPIINRLDESFRKGMDDPDFIKVMARLEMAVTYRNSTDTKKHIEEASVRLEKLIRELNIPKEDETK
jgi:tripartite-type tricarboxylate transporter receptor subunit TctC